MYLGGAGISISHLPQQHVVILTCKFQASVPEMPGNPFFNSASTHRVEDLPQAQHSEHSGALVTGIPAHLQGVGSTLESQAKKIRSYTPHPVLCC